MKPSGLTQRFLSADANLTRCCLLDRGETPKAYAVAAVFAHLGDGILVAILGMALWLAMPSERTHIWQSAVAVAVCAAPVAAIKLAVKRVRPLGEESARWSAAGKHDVHAFPSGHAARVVCVAAFSVTTWPRVFPWLALWALLVGVARVLVGAHHWLDVLAGWVLGAVVAIGALAAISWLA